MAKRRKHRDEIRDYMLSCECCPLCKQADRLVDRIINGVMTNLGYSAKEAPFVCKSTGNIVNPKKPKEHCAFRDKYYRENGFRPAGLIDGLVSNA